MFSLTQFVLFLIVCLGQVFHWSLLGYTWLILLLNMTIVFFFSLIRTDPKDTKRMVAIGIEYFIYLVAFALYMKYTPPFWVWFVLLAFVGGINVVEKK